MESTRLSNDMFRQASDRNIRIFLSSTFHDMEGEREYLMKVIFPELENYARQKNVNLVELDLRWGITEKDSSNGKILEICLDEIKNTRPFFIGLIGSRYGWMPTKDEITGNETLLEKHPWLSQDIENGLSITEIEIQYGVLRCKEPLHAFFYIREDTANSLEFQEDKETLLKLESLKRQIKDQQKYLVHNYNTLESLGGQIKSAIKSLIDDLYPNEKNDAYSEMEYEQSAIMGGKTKIYYPLNECFSFLNSFVDGNENCLVIKGESGAGKSALLANWIRYRQSKGDTNLFYHFVDNSHYGANYLFILERLCKQLKDYFQLSIETFQQDDPELIITEFAQLMDQLNNQKIILIIDSINQLRNFNDVHELNWLPVFKNSIKFICTTTENTRILEILKNRNFLFYNIPLLVIKFTRQEIVNTFLSQFGKRLPENVVEMIVDSQVSQNAFILRSLLDEVRIYGRYEKVSSFIKDYVAANNYETVLLKILDRMENDFMFNNRNITKEVFSLIAISRNGLTERSLSEILNVPPIYISPLYYGARHFLVTMGGFINFSHDLIKQTVVQRYLLDKNVEIYYRRLLADFLKNEYDTMVDKDQSRFFDIVSEYPWQLFQLDADNELHSFMVNRLVFIALWYMSNTDFYQYWDYLCRHNYSLVVYLDVLKPEELYLLFILISFNHDLGRGNDEKVMLDVASEWTKNVGDDNDKISLFQYWAFYYRDYTKDFAQAKYNIEKYIELASKRMDMRVGLTRAMDFYGNLLSAMGDKKSAENILMKAISLYQETKNEIGEALSYSNLGIIYANTQRFNLAELYYEKAMHMINRLAQTNSLLIPYKALFSYNLSILYSKMGLEKLSFEYGLIALASYKALMEQNRLMNELKYAGVIVHISMHYKQSGKYQKAIEYLEEAYGIYRSWEQKNPGAYMHNLSELYSELGVNYSSLKQFNLAEENLMKAYKLISILAEQKPYVYTIQQALLAHNLGTFKRHTHDFAEAKQWYFKAVELFQDVIQKQWGDCSDKLAALYDALAKIEMEDNHKERAFDYLKKSCEIYNDLCKRAPEVYLNSYAEKYCAFATFNEGEQGAGDRISNMETVVSRLEIDELTNAQTLACYHLLIIGLKEVQEKPYYENIEKLRVLLYKYNINNRDGFYLYLAKEEYRISDKLNDEYRSEEAIEWVEKAILDFGQIKDYDIAFQLARSERHLANLCDNIHQQEKADYYYKLSLYHWKSINDTNNVDIQLNLALTQMDYGIFLCGIEKYKEAEGQYLQSLFVMKQLSNIRVSYLGNLAELQENIGNLYDYMERKEEAEQYYLASIFSLENLMETTQEEVYNRLAKVQGNYGIMLLRNSELDKGIDWLIKARDNRLKLSEYQRYYVSKTDMQLARAFCMKKDFEKAYMFIKEAISILEQYKDRSSNILLEFADANRLFANICSNIAMMKETLEAYVTAYQIYKLFSRYNPSFLHTMMSIKKEVSRIIGTGDFLDLE